MPQQVQIIGGGPAGAAAALAALQAGADVCLFEKSKFPRHKVCGEFLSPSSLDVLGQLKVLSEFEAAGPSAIRRVHLQFGTREKNFLLPETAWGLSRATLDQLLLTAAGTRGAKIQHQRTSDAARPLVVAHGRHAVSTSAEKGQRLFGFKAHWKGPVSDVVELYFFSGCYVGINPAGSGVMNVCGLGPEHVLQRFNFEHDEVLASCRPLRNRLMRFERSMRWLSVGPLRFENHFEPEVEESVYPAGDALSFVDPFTGSGMLAALRTGMLAGQHAAQGRSPSEYMQKARQALENPFRVSSVLRWAITQAWAEHVARLIPGKLLFNLTRPRLQ